MKARHPGLLVCPQRTFDFAWSIFGPRRRLAVAEWEPGDPCSAVIAPSLAFVTVRQPISPFVEIEVRVNGRPHFDFAQPVTVVLDYSRCPESSLPAGPLTAGVTDPLTNEFIEDMHGVDDRAARTVTFTTDHFSGYAVAQ